MFQGAGSPQYKAAMLIRTQRELSTLTDLDLLDREYIVKALRGALTARVAGSDAANVVIADALARNTTELIGLLDEVIHRATLPRTTGR